MSGADRVRLRPRTADLEIEREGNLLWITLPRPQVPTTENIALDIWRRLEPRLKDGRRKLHGVRVYETPDLYVDYFGEPACSA